MDQINVTSFFCILTMTKVTLLSQKFDPNLKINCHSCEKEMLQLLLCEEAISTTFEIYFLLTC